MIDKCDQCGAEKSSFATICPQCGTRFGSANSAEDLLQRTANNNSWQASIPPVAVGSANRNPGAYQYAIVQGPRRKMPSWVLPACAAAFIGIIVFMGLGGYKLWMDGPGGDIACNSYNMAGNDATERGDWDTANDDYAQMIAIRPNRVDGYLLRGMNEDKAKQYVQAIDDDTVGLTKSSIPIMRGDLFFNRAMAEYSAGRVNKAINDYVAAKNEYADGSCGCSESVEQQKADISKRRNDTDDNLGYLYYVTKNYPSTVKLTSDAVSIQPGDDYGYLLRGKAELALSKDASALRDFNEALQLKPNDEKTLSAISDVVGKTQQYSVGVTVLSKAALDASASVDTLGNLGWDQYETGLLSEALVSDNRALSLNSTKDVGWIRFNLGLTYAALGKTALSQAAYTDALAHSSEWDRKGAIPDLQNLLVKQPNSTIARTELAKVKQAVNQDLQRSRLLRSRPGITPS